jgi:hypothetical protein
MTKSCELPPEFKELEGKVHYVAERVKGQEYSSACFQCGGEIHPDGSFPDRFRMFVASKANGKPAGWCRHCGVTFFPDRENGSRYQPTPEQQAIWLAEQKRRERERFLETQRARELINREEIWEKYHNHLTDEARELYKKRGIDNQYWLDFWGLGYCPFKRFAVGEQFFSSPSLTIPVFTPDKKVLTIEHRLLNPQDPGDKYRPEVRGLPAVIFIADYERELKDKGKVLVLEGKFKAMTTFIMADDPKLHVIGLPSKSPDLELLEQLKDCDLIFCLDPDAYFLSDKQKAQGMKTTAALRLAEHFKDRARFMQLGGKIDDMLMAGQLDKIKLKKLMGKARRLA